MTQNNGLIELSEVSKVFHTSAVETHALDRVGLRVGEGEFVAIEGPSGCGKTTLLSILGLLDVPTSGHYRLAGRDVGRLDAGERARMRNQRIGFVFQAFHLVGNLTVRQNVELPLLYGSQPTAARRQAVERALERVGMIHRADHHPAELSGGQQQRVAVARAVVTDPALLLADEPTGNLDTTNSETVMDLLGELHQEGATIVMVTHDPRWTARVERTVHMMDGRVLNSSKGVVSAATGA